MLDAANEEAEQEDAVDSYIFLGMAVVILIIFAFSSYLLVKNGIFHYESFSQSATDYRRYFLISISVFTLYKFACMVFELVVYSSDSCDKTHMCSFVRFSPDLFLLSAYSVLILHWSQLVASMEGAAAMLKSKLFVRVALIANGVVYVLFAPILIFHPQQRPMVGILIFLGAIHVIVFALLVYYGHLITKHLPSNMLLSQRIADRFLPLCSLCAFSACVGAVVYIAIEALWADGYPTERLLLFDAIVVGLKDAVPCGWCLWLLRKRARRGGSTAASAAIPVATSSAPATYSTFSYLAAPPPPAARSAPGSGLHYSRIETLA